MPYKDPEKQKEHSRAYAAANSDKIVARATAWNKENSERRKEISQKYWQRNKHKVDKDKRKDAMLNRTYGITLEQFNAMLEKQGNKCAICNEPFNNSKKSTKPHVDHNHTTGKIRSLLCHGCNIGVGAFKEDSTILQKAVEYLGEHQLSST